MGNNQSNARFYHKLYHIMPPVNKHGEDGPLSGWFDKSQKPFASDKDRDQFIYATLTVLTQNGVIDLKDHDFRLLYSRRETDRIVARIVAEKEGMIKAQIEPENDGKNQAEAFSALRRHVELRLDYILRDVPGASHSQTYRDQDDGQTIAGPSSSGSVSDNISPPMSPNAQARNDSNILAIEAPPAYGKAVKDWRTEDTLRKRKSSSVSGG